MAESIVLPQIKAIIAEINSKRDALNDYKTKLDAAKLEIETAREERKQNFSFETDKVVVEKESFIQRLERRYLEENQLFENELTTKLKLVENLFDDYVKEMWNKDVTVTELESQVIISFNQTVKLLSQYQDKPAQIKKTLLSTVVDDEFKKAFKGEMSFIGVNSIVLANKIPIGDETYQALYNAGRHFGAGL